MVIQHVPAADFRGVVFFDLLYGIPIGYVLVVPSALLGFVTAPVTRWRLTLALALVTGLAVQAAIGLGTPLTGLASAAENLIPAAAFTIAIAIGWLIVRPWGASPAAQRADERKP